MARPPSPQITITRAILFTNEWPIISSSDSPTRIKNSITMDMDIFRGSLLVFLYVFFASAFSLNGFILISLFRLVFRLLDVQSSWNTLCVVFVLS